MSKRIYIPRTARDYDLVHRWVLEDGLSNEEVFRRMENPHWRSRVYEPVGGLLCCAECDQVVIANTCFGCGQTLVEKGECDVSE